MQTNISFHKFRLPVFKAKVWVFIGDNISKQIDYAEDITSQIIANQEERKPIRAYTYAYEDDKGKRKYMLFFKYTAKPGEIAHEVKHLINILFHWHDYKLSATNDEMECYYLEDIVDKVHEMIKSYIKIYKNK